MFEMILSQMIGSFSIINNDIIFFNRTGILMNIEDFRVNTYFDKYLIDVKAIFKEILNNSAVQLVEISSKIFNTDEIFDIEHFKEEYFIIYKGYTVDIIANNYWYRFNGLKDLSSSYKFIEMASNGTPKQNQDYRDTVTFSLNMYETYCGSKALPDYQNKLLDEAVMIIDEGMKLGHITKIDVNLIKKRISYITKTMLDNYIFIGPMNTVFELRKESGLYRIRELGIAINKNEAIDIVKHYFEEDKQIAASSKKPNSTLSKIVKSLKKDKDNEQ